MFAHWGICETNTSEELLVGQLFIEMFDPQRPNSPTVKHKASQCSWRPLNRPLSPIIRHWTRSVPNEWKLQLLLNGDNGSRGIVRFANLRYNRTVKTERYVYRLDSLNWTALRVEFSCVCLSGERYAFTTAAGERPTTTGMLTTDNEKNPSPYDPVWLSASQSAWSRPRACMVVTCFILARFKQDEDMAIHSRALTYCKCRSSWGGGVIDFVI